MIHSNCTLIVATPVYNRSCRVLCYTPAALNHKSSSVVQLVTLMTWYGILQMNTQAARMYHKLSQRLTFADCSHKLNWKVSWKVKQQCQYMVFGNIEASPVERKVNVAHSFQSLENFGRSWNVASSPRATLPKDAAISSVIRAIAL
jgi:hypothetical protein